MRTHFPALVLMLVLAACHTQPGAQTASDEASGASSGGEARTVRLPQSAASYEPHASPENAVVGRGAAAIAAAVQRAGAAQGFTIAPDERLGQLAGWIADQRAHDGSLPSAAAMDLAARQLGLIEPLPTISMIATDAPSGLDDRVFDETSTFFAQRAYTHFGGVIRDEPDGQRCILVLSQRFVALGSMPRVVQVGAALEISGALVAGYAMPELAVTSPNGHVERGGAVTGSQIHFREQTSTAGVYRVELLAEGKLGTTVVANFPLYVGVTPPEQFEIVPEPRVAPGHEADVLLGMLNDERKRAGVMPLVLDDKLSAIARAHSEDMRAHGFVGHTSPTTGSAPDRVARAGVRTSLVLENIGRGYSLREVHDGLMASPGHRSNVVHPQATNVGIGVVTEPEHDRTAYLVTEVFTRVTSKLPSDVGTKLLEAINRVRAERGEPALREDTELNAVAQHAAQSYFASEAPTDAAIMAQLQKALSRPSKTPRRIGAVLTVVGGTDDLLSVSALANPNAHALGIGLAQGTRADAFPNAICAVLLVVE